MQFAAHSSPFPIELRYTYYWRCFSEILQISGDMQVEVHGAHRWLVWGFEKLSIDLTFELMTFSCTCIKLQMTTFFFFFSWNNCCITVVKTWKSASQCSFQHKIASCDFTSSVVKHDIRQSRLENVQSSAAWQQMNRATPAKQIFFFFVRF